MRKGWHNVMDMDYLLIGAYYKQHDSQQTWIMTGHILSKEQANK
jgi:hypothetical protein